MIKDVHNFLVQEGYRVSQKKGATMVVEDADGLPYVCALQDNIFSANIDLTPLSQFPVKKRAALGEVLLCENPRMHSSFGYAGKGRERRLILNLVCVLQNMGEEDQDDIRTVMEVLADDARAAYKLLRPFMKKK